MMRRRSWNSYLPEWCVLRIMGAMLDSLHKIDQVLEIAFAAV